MVRLQHIASTFASIAGKSKVAPDLISRVARAAQPLNYQTILDSISDDVDVIMIGEASHGTQDFYHHRAEITKLLLQEKGFNMIGLEADFPDTNRVNQFVLNRSNDKSAKQALSDYDRFPRWMWRNEVQERFINWLRRYNDSKDEENKSEIFGMDVYSLEKSRDAVLAFLDKYDPEIPGVAEIAQESYAGTSRRLGNSKGAARVLKELEKYHEKFPHFEELFVAVQNARCVKGCSDYYSNNCSWNTRDSHMFETVKQMMMRRKAVFDQRPKAVIWAHNSHLGNSLYTGMNDDGEINVGRLIKEHWGPDRAMSIGFTTFDGSVTASHEWGSQCDFKLVNPGMSGSVEELFHKAALQDSSRFEDNNFLMVFRSTGSKSVQADDELVEKLGSDRFEQRFIGVIYRPKTERMSHYSDVRVAKQFDMVIHVDKSKALRPLDIPEQWANNAELLNTF